MSKTNRRDFLLNYTPLMTAGLLLPGMAGGVMAAPSDDRANIVSPSASFFDSQADWRWCEKCYMLYWDGYADKGRCSAGGGHKGAATGSSNYALPYGNLPETANAQSNWRYCDKCHVMFFDGYPAKGRCAAGGGHNAQGFKFRLPHETRADAANQAGWRFCVKCSAMFWDAWAGKGSCPSGGGHAAAGFQFVLPLLPAPEFKRRSDVTTDGWAPIGGWTEVTLRPDGSCVFAGHIHNSGAINIRFTLGAVLITPSGQKLAFAMNNKRVDGTEVLVGRDRDYNWNEAGTFGEAAWAADNWSDLSRSTLHWKLVASSAVGSGVRSFLENIVIDVYNKLPGGEYKGLLIGKPLRLILSL